MLAHRLGTPARLLVLAVTSSTTPTSTSSATSPSSPSPRRCSSGARSSRGSSSRKRLESSLSRARLDYLEAQLQPHFLFNSLGAVSELAYDAPATANRVLRQLIAIFRTALARKSDEVTLGEEIVGIEPYLDIQRIRFADWLTIDYHVDDAAVDCLLPRFILQPLVENAIRHGLSGRSAAGTIDISATVEQRHAHRSRLRQRRRSRRRGARPRGRGIGLANVRDRLAIMYGDDDRLRLANSDGGGAVAELTIPVRRRDDRRAASREPTSRDRRRSATRISACCACRACFAVRSIAIAVDRGSCADWSGRSRASCIYTLRDRLGDASWFSIARNDMTSALIWALLTPLVLRWREAVPDSSRAPRRFARWRISSPAALTTFTHVALLQRLTGRAESAAVAPTGRLTLIVDFVIFCVLAAIGHRGVLLEWLRAREAASAALTRRARGRAGARREAAGDSTRAAAFARRHRRNGAPRSRAHRATAHAPRPTICASRSSAPTNAA